MNFRLSEKNNNAFTLIEVVISVAIFSLIVAAPTGFLVSSLRAQTKALGSQELLDNVSYGLEHISRSLRMTKKDRTGDCVGLENINVNYVKTLNGIKFLNYDNVCYEIFLEQGILKEERDNGENVIVNDLTPDDLEVTSFDIGPDSSWGQNENFQPRITLFLEIKLRGDSTESSPEIKIQTTISQRDLDVTY